MPGMFERTISIGSVGKAFNVTGWKCGWALTGNPHLMAALRKAHSTSVYTLVPPIQEATARVFEIEFDKLVEGDHRNSYWVQTTQTIVKKRDHVIRMMSDLGFEIVEPEGGYFVVVDCQKTIDKLDLSRFHDPRGKTFAFVHWLSQNGLQTLPIDMFFSDDNKHLAEGLLRLCFMKSDESLVETQRVLTQLKDKIDDHNKKG